MNEQQKNKQIYKTLKQAKKDLRAENGYLKMWVKSYNHYIKNGYYNNEEYRQNGLNNIEDSKSKIVELKNYLTKNKKAITDWNNKHIAYKI